MRYDTEVAFCLKTQGEYNSRTGNYNAGFTSEKVMVASVTDITEEEQRVIFGSLLKGACAIRLRSHFSGSFDYIRIGTKKYAVRGFHGHRSGDVFYLSEMQ